MATKKTIARTKRGTKRSDITRRTGAEKPGGAVMRELVERTGIPVDDAAQMVRNREEEQLVRDRVGDSLLLACDQLSEEIAAIKESGGGDYENVADALLTIWRLRWEIGLTPAKASEQAAGGAS